MMTIAIDTNILLDILIPDTEHSLSSKNLLDDAYSQGALIINEIVYAELATQFEDQKTLDSFLRDTGIRLEPSSNDSLYQASRAWQKYRGRRGEKVTCPICGQKQRLKCLKCGAVLSKRHRIISDFLIGSHALNQADGLLSRDRGYYRTYFKNLKIKSTY